MLKTIEKTIITMTCKQDLRGKMKVLVKLLLSFSIIVFNMIKLLAKTFIMKLFV